MPRPHVCKIRCSCGKIGFTTRTEAKRQARRTQRENAEAGRDWPLGVYVCDQSGYYHFGHRPRRKGDAA